MATAVRRRARVDSFWAGFVAFWLGFGILYVIFRAGINEETRLASLTLGELGRLLLLVVLWPLEVLGADVL